MSPSKAYSPQRILLPVGIGTCLSLMGDASLYVVLPTHMHEAGVTLANVGILLSANRFIRLIVNGPAGVVYDRSRRRRLFVPALFLGAFSTATYALTEGFWPLLIGRLLWGLAWVGIWIGGNTIALDISRADTRGRWVGVYQISFFAGAAGGALLGGFMTDKLGYHQAMAIDAGLTLMGAIVALVFLPETRGLQTQTRESAVQKQSTALPVVATGELASTSNATLASEFATTVGLYSVHRFSMAGVLQPTFGLFLLGLMGAQIQIAGLTVGVATLTGLALGLTTLVSATSAPLIGNLSDRSGDRWGVAARGLVPGVAGFSLLALGTPIAALIGVPLAAITGGSNQGLSTVLIGDLGDIGRQSRRLGVMFTAGDLASAIGPPLAYWLIPSIGIRSIYFLIAGALVLMIFAIWSTERKRRTFSYCELDIGAE